ncbi:hypothetical protein FWC31_03030 [Candidatus Saccharibacteria bacterium]|nr:hypothetical protein [Candidatus Saccharibacteria bacterium]
MLNDSGSNHEEAPVDSGVTPEVSPIVGSVAAGVVIVEVDRHRDRGPDAYIWNNEYWKGRLTEEERNWSVRKWLDWFREDEKHFANNMPPWILGSKEAQQGMQDIMNERFEKENPLYDYDPEFISTEEKRGELYKRAFLNSDRIDFLNGKETTYINPLLKTRSGEPTHRLSLELIKSGFYDDNIRYIMRSILANLIKTGSKTEKSVAVYFAKNLLNEIGFNAYPGLTEDMVNADAQYSILQADADYYAASGDKPDGYQGRGFVRKKALRYADKTSPEIQYVLFSRLKDDGRKVFEDSPISAKRISQTLDKFGKSEDIDYASNYSSLNSTGKGRIDSIIEFTNTLKKGKALDTIQGFSGSDQGILVDAFRVYSLLAKGSNEKIEWYDQNAMMMLRLLKAGKESTENVRNTMGELRTKAVYLIKQLESPAVTQLVSEELMTAIRDFTSRTEFLGYGDSTSANDTATSTEEFEAAA